MRYDLNLIHELCQELGFRSRLDGEGTVEIELKEDCVLVFQNFEGEDDCLVGFRGTPWHGHGNFTFVDARSYYVEMDYLDVVSGLADGSVLDCERWLEGELVDRWLTHRDYNDEFKYMEPGEELQVWRSKVSVSDRDPNV